jgi:hypothetical protein
MTTLSRLALTSLTLLVVLGCAKSTSQGPTRDPFADKKLTNDLRQLGLAYHNYMDTMGGQGPDKPDDLSSFVENDQRLINPLKSGDIVLIYKVRLTDMTDGANNYVLGYAKEVPTKGGLVLLGDAKVVTMTAEEFKKAKLAKPAEKKDGK